MAGRWRLWWKTPPTLGPTRTRTRFLPHRTGKSTPEERPRVVRQPGKEHRRPRPPRPSEERTTRSSTRAGNKPGGPYPSPKRRTTPSSTRKEAGKEGRKRSGRRKESARKRYHRKQELFPVREGDVTVRMIHARMPDVNSMNDGLTLKHGDVGQETKQERRRNRPRTEQVARDIEWMSQCSTAVGSTPRSGYGGEEGLSGTLPASAKGIKRIEAGYGRFG